MVFYEFELEKLREYCLLCGDDFMAEKITTEMLALLHAHDEQLRKIDIPLEILADTY